MSICDELIELEKDVQAVPFTQSEWEDALIETWRKDGTISGAVARASKTPYGMVITSGRWDLLFNHARTLKPLLSEYTSGRNRVRVWIAKNATFANDKLWDGDFALAKKLLSKGGSAQGGRTKNINEAKKQQMKDSAGLLAIRVRERDKRTDWGTCK